MARSIKKPPILLDWFNVSYRSVVIVVVLVVAALAVAGGYWYHQTRISPKSEASEAILRATQRLSEADRLEGDERVREAVANARSSLEEARRAFDSRDYVLSLQAAIRSENLSIKAIDLVRGRSGSTLVRFLRIEGDVKVKVAGEFAWEAADSKMLLREGDQVKTSSNASAQILYFDGTKTTIQPGSLLEIRDLYMDPVTKVRRVREKLTWGEVEASTQKRNVEGSYHEVSTDAAAARSTDESDFRVAYDQEEKKASYDVFTGQVEVSSSDRKESLKAGERILSTTDGRLTAKELLPAVPRLISPSDQRVFVYDDPSEAEMTLKWEGVGGADRYRLAISDKTLFTNALYDDERGDTSAVLEGISAGAYYWKVAAITSRGVQGPFSEVRRFRVTSQRIRDKGDTTPPDLEITDHVLTGPMLIVNGRTEPGALLWIDNEKTDVYDDGKFYAVIRLRKEGWNEIEFVSQDASGNEMRIRHRAYVETY